ncbi:MAG: complex I subunit 1 family protein [Armatimonadota bacterium]|nr:complex I subunit 1 family protein [Armatimonadota bacterium]
MIGAVAAAMMNILLALLVAPLLEGIIRRITARIQSRKGPPLTQPYLDLLKLLGKEDLETGVSPGMQRFAALLALGAVLAVATMIPMGLRPPMDGAGDVVLLIYLLALCGISTLLAGLAAGTTYSLLGMSREMMAMIALEPLLAVALVLGAVQTGSLRLEAVLAGSVYAGTGPPVAGLVMLGVMVLAFQAFVGRVPYDMAEAETEIMEGALVEYSGPKLALFKYARMVKLFVYSALFCALFAPWGSAWMFPVGVLALLAKTLLLVLFVTVVAATHARYRIDQAIRYYAALLAVAVAALIVAVVTV